MDFQTKLHDAAAKNRTLVCVGLDPDEAKLPQSVQEMDEPLYEFNKRAIEATAEFVCAYKPNSAFYEARGAAGIVQLKQTCDFINENFPGIPIILDAKRADIGNTNNGYVKFAFDYLGVDAITVQPYLGGEAIQPFLDRKDKGVIVLCRTSNEGAGEFQDLETGGEKLYRRVAQSVAEQWDGNGNCLLVVGATYPAELAEVREIVGDDMWFLVPGIGAQGGDVEATLKAGLTSRGDGLIINSSRGIIYASNGSDFAHAAGTAAKELRDTINQYR